jgi:hypothetical protein
VNQTARRPQQPINGIRERPGHLLHPRGAGLGVNAGDSESSATAIAVQSTARNRADAPVGDERRRGFVTRA